MRHVIAIDTETVPFSPGNMAPQMVCLSVSSGELFHRDQAEPVLRDLLRGAASGELKLTAHNAAFDFAVIMATFPDLIPLIFRAYSAEGITCTALREKLLDVAEGVYRQEGGYSLKEIGQRSLGRDVKEHDEWRLQYGVLDASPIGEWPETARQYPIDDATACLAIYEHQQQRADRIHYEMPTQDLEARAQLALQLIHVWGIHTDGDRVQALWDSLETQIQDLEERLLVAGVITSTSETRELFQLGGNLKSKSRKNMNVIRELVRAAWPPALGKVPLTDTGRIACDADTIAQCDSEILARYSEWNSLRASVSTFVSKLFDGIDKPLHPSFGFTVAARSSSYNPNLQNQPRRPGVRECFRARSGRVFVSADYSTQEMRTLAQTLLDLFGRSKLADRFRKDLDFDPHQEFADAQKCSRQHAKIANFGIPGGMGIPGLIKYAKGYGQTWDAAFAKNIRDGFFRQWPLMTDYFRHIDQVVGSAGFGRVVIQRSGYWREGCGYCDAANAYFQTLAAHASKDALFDVVRRCYSEPNSWLYGSRAVNFVHDEIILEVFEEAIHETARELVQVMEERMAAWTPDIPTKAEAVAMRFWSKDAKGVFDTRGRLIVWGEGQ